MLLHNTLNTLRIFTKCFAYIVSISKLSCASVAPFSQVHVCHFLKFRKLNKGMYDAGLAVNGISGHCHENRFSVSEVEIDGRIQTWCSVFLLGRVQVEQQGPGVA